MKRIIGFVIAIVLLVLFPAFGISPSVAQTGSLISPTEVRQLQSSNTPATLVDVRMSQSFNMKHIEGAINIPAFSIGKKVLPSGKIVIYDGGIGTREARDAMEKLTAAGNTSVFILEGGIAGWEAMGLPMTVQTGVLTTRLTESISVKELSQAMSDGLDLIITDIRMPDAVQQGTIGGARNIVPDDLMDVSRGWRKDSIIILIDGGDDEALKQSEKLRRAGFKLVRFLYGGFPEWKRQNAQ